MPSLKDNFEKLKLAIVGTKTTNIDKKLDKAIVDITNYRAKSGRNGYIDLVRSLIGKSSSGFTVDSQNSGIFGQGGSSPAAFGQAARMTRYRTYQSISVMISYCYRALDVLTENIIAPDDITKHSLDVKSKKFLEGEDEQVGSKTLSVKDTIKKLKLDNNLNMIVRNTLLFGDFFCEIADAKTALTSKAYLAEQQILNNGLKDIFEVDGRKISIDYSSFSESDLFVDEAKKKKEDNIKNLNLVFHDPNQIIKLQSELFPLCFGYLVFPKANYMPNAHMQDMGVNDICVSIIKSIEKKIPQIAEFNDKELKDIIKTMLASGVDQNKMMNIRFIPPNRMQHFMRPSTKYHPYGESIFESAQFTAKVLIALETALAVQRINRSTEKRKVSVEIGLPRDARKMIESLKEEFRKRKVSLDSFGTVDTIPSMVSTFEDIYIPTKDGKHFVDVQSFSEGNIDTRSKVDELNFLRDQVVASLGVPASFLNIEENLCLTISNTYIPLLSGEIISLEEVIRNYELEKQMWVYSYDHNIGKLVPGKITWAGKTKLQTSCIRVHLDNGESIDCTPEHPFMLRDGTYKEAQYLEENESLMPFYTKNSNSVTSGGHSYQSIYNPGLDSWQLTHRMVVESLKFVKQGDSKHVHHKDFNPRNNQPENLQGLYPYQHLRIHGTEDYKDQQNRCVTVLDKCSICESLYEKTPGINQITCSKKCRQERKRLDGIKSYKKRKKEKGNKLRPDLTCFICGQATKWINVEITDKRYEQLKSQCLSCEDPNCKSRIKAVSNLTKKGTKLYSNIEYRNCSICNNIYLYSEEKINKKNILLTNICGSMKCINTILARRAAKNKKQKASVKLTCPICGDSFEKPRWVVNSHKYKISCDKLNCKQKQYSSVRSMIESNKKVAGLNHKVIKIELLEGLYDTGDITIENYHNFAVNSGVIVHNSAKATLAEENVLFARTIIGHQKYLTHQITDLIQKVYDIIKPEEALTLTDNISISFPPPKSLQFEREARYISELANLIETLERVGIPKAYTTKKYLTHFDWEEMKNYEIDGKIEKSIGTTKDEENMGSMSGGGMSF